MNIKTDFKSLANRAARILLAAAILLATQTAEAASPTVTMKESGKTVETLIQKLRKEQPDYNFLFNNEELKNRGVKSISLEKATLADALKTILEGTGLTYEIDDEIVVIKPAKGVKKEPVTVTGVVKDAQGEPLTGVGVTIMNTNQGCATDYDGRFTLKVPDEYAVLRFSMIGMEPQQLMVGKRKSFDVTMKENRNMMEEVVVTGYQTISKERSAGSYSIVSGDEVADKANMRGSIMESLEGLTTGLSVNYGEGQEKFLIRGITSINSTRSPLYVVDGIPMSADSFENLINSNDIANITFLKDATAASIWGAQAANGVVVVTTKTGSDNDNKVKFTYNGSFTYKGKPRYSYYDYMSSETFMKTAQEIFDPDYYTWNSVSTTSSGIGGSLPIVYPHEQIMYDRLNGVISDSEASASLDRLASLNNRGQIDDNFYTGAYLTQHSLSFRGGKEKHRFYGSFGYKHNAAYTRDHSNEYQLNLKQTFKLASWLHADLGVNLALDDTKTAMQPSSTNLNSLLPYMMFADEEGNAISHASLLYYEPNRLEYERKSGKSLDYRPLTDNSDGFNKTSGYDARVNLGISAQLLKGLTYDGRFHYQRGHSKNEQFYGQDSYRVRSELVSYATVDAATGAPVFALPVSGGYYRTNQSNTTNWTVRNQLSFDHVFEKIESQFTALAGIEVRSDKVNSQTTTLRGYNPQTMTYSDYDVKSLATVGVKSPIIPTTSGVARLSASPERFSEVEKRYVSMYANGAYTFRNRYSLNASVRVDRSNLFGSDHSVQFKPIWSAGAAWRIAEEDFMRSYSFLNRLNLRLSYGLGGNSPDPGLGGPYDILYPINNAIFSSLGQGYVVITPANDKLVWEKTRIFNAGIDFDMFSHRLSGSVDLYFKNTTDLLGNIALHPSSGWVSALSNFGSMRNRGVELSLKSQNIRGRDFNWYTDFTLTYNKNKVTELYVEDGNAPSSLIYKNFVEGYSAQSLFAYRWAGLDDMGDPQVFNENGEKVKLSKDLNDVSALRCMGSMQPLWYGGLTNTFNYKDFSLSFMFIYNLGHKMRNDVNSFWSGRLTANIHKDFDSRWRKPGDEALTDIPSYVSNGQLSVSRREENFYRFADINVVDASYIKLRDLSLTYLLPKTVCDKFSCDNVKLRLQVSNLFYWAANGKGIDPESHSFRNGGRLSQFGPSYSVGLTIDLK